MTNLKRYIAAAILAGGLASAAHGVAAAEPASIDDGQSPREVGASIESGSGAPGPNYSKPAEKPSRGDFATDSDYRMAVSGWEAGERARIANLAASRGK